jgi:hypothetical protein
MATGSLRLRVTDLLGEPIGGMLNIDFAPAGNSPGGTAMEASLQIAGETDIVVDGIQCRPGPGTLYTVRVNARNFRPYAFFQLMVEQKANTPSESPIRLMVKPKRVVDIEAPAFPALDAPLRRLLDSAFLQALEPADRDLMGLQGAALYDKLGPLRKACLLNIFAKASHASADRCFGFLRWLVTLHQDRCFCSADPGMPEFLRRSERFKSAPATLHAPLSGYCLEDSFKSKDAHANLQVTFMRDKRTGGLAADVDLDEASGVEHGFEVIRNAATQGRTNPYVIREFLLLFDPVEKVLDPRYRFEFRGQAT